MPGTTEHWDKDDDSDDSDNDDDDDDDDGKLNQGHNGSFGPKTLWFSNTMACCSKTIKAMGSLSLGV